MLVVSNHSYIVLGEFDSLPQLYCNLLKLFLIAFLEPLAGKLEFYLNGYCNDSNFGEYKFV